MLRKSKLSQAIVEALLGEETVLSYKGFCGSCSKNEYGDGDFYHGKILGIEALVTYEADNKADMYAAFCSAVDDYLEDRNGSMSSD